jgi:cell division protein FtsL
MTPTNNQQSGSAPQPTRVREDWKQLVERVSYFGIVNNITYMVFVVLLCVLYISNDQFAIQTQRVINRNNESIMELRWKYMDIKQKLMHDGMEDIVIRSAMKLDLKVLELPAYKISADSSNTFQP